MEYIKYDIFTNKVVSLEYHYNDDYTVESLADIFDNIGNLFSNVVDFFKRATNNGIVEILDDKIFNTKLLKELYIIEKKDLIWIKNYKFLDIADVKIKVFPGLAYKVDLISTFIKDNIDTLVDGIKDLEEFEKEIANFITHEAHRQSPLTNMHKYQSMEKKQVELQNDLDSLLDSNQYTISTIKEVYGNFNGLERSLTNTIDVMKRYDESDVKRWVKSVRNLNNRLNAIIEIIDSEYTIPKDNIKAMAYIINVLANHMTILSKFYTINYNIGLVLTNTRDILKK